MKYPLILELVKHKMVAIQYTESRDQHAGNLMKPLGATALVGHRRLLMNLSECFFFACAGLNVGLL